jgi:hypothetical protein
VAHDRHDRRTLGEIRRIVLVGLEDLLLVGGVLDLDLAPDLVRDQLDLVVRERLRHRLRDPEAHQDRDDLGHRHAEGLRQVLHRHARLDGDGTGRGRDRLLLLLARLAVLRAALLARVGARPAGRGVDDDAAAAPPSGAARANGPVRTISHQLPV